MLKPRLLWTWVAMLHLLIVPPALPDTCLPLMRALGFTSDHLEGTLEIPPAVLDSLIRKPDGTLYYLDSGGEAHILRRFLGNGDVRILRQYFADSFVELDKVFFMTTARFEAGKERFLLPKNMAFLPHLKRVEYDDVRGYSVFSVLVAAYEKKQLRRMNTICDLYNKRLEQMRDDFAAQGWYVDFTPPPTDGLGFGSLAVGRTKEELKAGDKGFRITSSNVILNPATLEMTLIDRN